VWVPPQAKKEESQFPGRNAKKSARAKGFEGDIKPEEPEEGMKKKNKKQKDRGRANTLYTRGNKGGVCGGPSSPHYNAKRSGQKGSRKTKVSQMRRTPPRKRKQRSKKRWYLEEHFTNTSGGDEGREVKKGKGAWSFSNPHQKKHHLPGIERHTGRSGRGSGLGQGLIKGNTKGNDRGSGRSEEWEGNPAV